MFAPMNFGAQLINPQMPAQQFNVNTNQFHLFYTNNKLFEIQDYHGNDFKIIGTNICSYINDCTSVISNNYTINEFVKG